MIVGLLLMVVGQLPKDYPRTVGELAGNCIKKYGGDPFSVIDLAPCYLGRKPWPDQVPQDSKGPPVYWDQFVKQARAFAEKKDSNETSVMITMRETLVVTQEEVTKQKELVDKMSRSTVNRYLNVAWRDLGKTGQFRSESEQKRRLAFEKMMLEDAKKGFAKSENDKAFAKIKPNKLADEINVNFKPKTLEEYRAAADIAAFWVEWSYTPKMFSPTLRSDLLDNEIAKRSEYNNAKTRGVK